MATFSPDVSVNYVGDVWVLVHLDGPQSTQGQFHVSITTSPTESTIGRLSVTVTGGSGPPTPLTTTPDFNTADDLPAIDAAESHNSFAQYTYDNPSGLLPVVAHVQFDAVSNDFQLAP